MTQLRACCLGHPTLYRSCVLANYFALLIAVIGFVATTPFASAASFDCARAATPREKLICREPELSDLDAQLGRTYQQKRTVLSAHGAELLQRSQQSWLRFIAVVCPMAVSSDGRQVPKSCIEKHYKERLAHLAKVGQQIGPLLFNRVDVYAAKPAPDKDSPTPGFYVQHIAYPQIDNSDSPAIASWNKQNVQNLPRNDNCDGGPGDQDIEYQIGYANARMISPEWTTSFDCHGTSHGESSIEARNIVLLPDPRPLTAKDVFGTEDRWVTKLRELFWDALRASGGTSPDHQVESVKVAIADSVIRPDHWLFTSEGLQVSFGSYEVGSCYVCNPGPLTVP